MVSKKFSAIELSGNDISKYHTLTIRISNRIVEYSIFDSAKKMFVALESWDIDVNDDPGMLTDVLEKIKNDSPLLNNEFERVIIIPDTSIYTIIPEKLFVEKDARKYLEFNYIIHSNEKVCIDNIDKIKVKNVYGFSYEVENAAEKLFLNHQFMHTSTILINTILSLNTHDVVFANINYNRIDILVKRSDALKFCNSFFFTSPEDVIYYLMNVYQQLSLDAASFPLILAGEIEQGSDMFNLVYRYIKKVSFKNRPEEFMYCKGIQKLPGQKYFCLYQCLL